MEQDEALGMKLNVVITTLEQWLDFCILKLRQEW
jgi:hypothetical protein